MCRGVHALAITLSVESQTTDRSLEIAVDATKCDL